MMAIRLALVVLVVSASLPGIADECAACDVSGSPKCLKMVDQAGYGAGFRELYRRLNRAGGDTIRSEELTALFRVDNDPCERGDTVIGGSALRNAGKACRLTSTMSIGGQAVAVDVLIPPVLIANVAAVGSAHEILASGEPIHVVINNRLLNADWGGPVTKVRFGLNQARIARPIGCIQFEY